MQLKNLGAGNPDGGLFTPDQIDSTTGKAKDLGKPSRGVIEVKAPTEAVDNTATTAQIAKYWDRYKLILVTNLRDWLLIGERGGKLVHLERFTLATDDSAFWVLASSPAEAQNDQGQAFEDFLARVLVHAAPLAEPRDLAFLLASYAREALHRVEHADSIAGQKLDALKQSLEQSLGVSFQEEEGGRFFRSTLVQTLFYGLFSAWVLRHEQGITGPFDWRSAEYSLNVPMVAALFGQLSQPAKLKALNLTEVLDWAVDAINRVDQQTFFVKFESTRAIQYFYEPFLAAFDPSLRKSLGVWYTPETIVRYQVARVDQVLQTELGLADGLADPTVVVLDPCCGTGTYLLEVLRVIAARLKAKGLDALTAHHVKEAALTRVFGFELLPAPYVVAHLQLGLLLRNLGTALGDDERVGVYLTNALTGWEPPKHPKTEVFPFPEFEHERKAADNVKRTQKILVILGNPPYDAFGGVAQGEEQDLVVPYKVDLIKKWGIKKFNLDDLYVRFFRLAERRIAEQNHRGVVSFISNYSWSSEPSFVVMRERLFKQFDKFWIENMHGNRNISEYAPDGRTSETIFAQKGFSPGIRQGVVISLWVKTGSQHQNTQVFYRDDINSARAEDRRTALLATLDDAMRDEKYAVVLPSKNNRYSFRPSKVSLAYASWPTLIALSARPPVNGLMEKRGGGLIDITREALIKRMELYFRKDASDVELALGCGSLVKNAARFDAKKARAQAIYAEEYSEARVLRYAVRPFDTRFAYYTPVRPVWNEPRPTLWKQYQGGNSFLLSRMRSSSGSEGFPMSFTRCLPDDHYIVPDAACLPFIDKPMLDRSLFQKEEQEILQPEIRANLGQHTLQYLHSLGFSKAETNDETREIIWMHALAIGYSPLYLTDNADGIRDDWPRIPLPTEADRLLASAELGRKVAALLDTEAHVPGVTNGIIRDELKTIGIITRQDGGSLTAAEFSVTAGWGRAGKADATMPGQGKLKSRSATPQELFSPSAPHETLDVYLNGTAYWKNIPQPVWNFTIGGYQVIKKWLSYREQSLLGRALTSAEIDEVTAIARRLAALTILQPLLDENYALVTSETYALRC